MHASYILISTLVIKWCCAFLHALGYFVRVALTTLQTILIAQRLALRVELFTALKTLWPIHFCLLTLKI